MLSRRERRLRLTIKEIVQLIDVRKEMLVVIEQSLSAKEITMEMSIGLVESFDILFEEIIYGSPTRKLEVKNELQKMLGSIK